MNSPYFTLSWLLFSHYQLQFAAKEEEDPISLQRFVETEEGIYQGSTKNNQEEDPQGQLV